MSQRIECRTYTHARRFPLVIGNLWGYRLRRPATLAQAVVAVGALLALLWTHRVWARFGMWNLVVLIAIPSGLGFVVRHAKAEGRSILRYLLGVLSALSVPPNGKVAGKPHRPTRTAVAPRSRIFVADLPPEGSGDILPGA